METLFLDRMQGADHDPNNSNSSKTIRAQALGRVIKVQKIKVLIKIRSFTRGLKSVIREQEAENGLKWTLSRIEFAFWPTPMWIKRMK